MRETIRRALRTRMHCNASFRRAGCSPCGSNTILASRVLALYLLVSGLGHAPQASPFALGEMSLYESWLLPRKILATTVSRCYTALIMRAIPVAAVVLLTASAALAQKADDTVTITSFPDGAKVEWNRKVIGTTPTTYKVGEYAFNEKKRSLLSKRLEQPVVVRISKDGYAPKELTITKEMTWTSLNGKNSYTYYIITSNTFDFQLDKTAIPTAALTNADVIKLKTTGFGDDLIIDKINSTPTAFHLGTDDLVELHNAGISDAIIQAMMHKN